MSRSQVIARSYMSDNKYVGEVIWFNKTYGFIAWEKEGVKQKDMFCHFTDIVSEGYRTLSKGQMVSFNVGENNSGDPKAINITPISMVAK